MAPTLLPRWLNMGRHGPNIRPTWAQDEPNIGPTWANIGPRWARWLNMGPTWPTISPRWAQDGSTWARLGPTWAQPALNIGPDCFHTGKHCALCLPQFNIALPGFARRISAQSSHTISQTSLLGRRPAVRRKPLGPGAGHEASPCPCRRASVVTEGYRRCLPCRRPPRRTPGPPPNH